MKRKKNGSTELILMSIKDAALGTFKLTDFPYYVQEDRPNSRPKPMGEVASIVGAEIRLNSGAGGAMMFDDGDGNLDFSYQDNDVHTLTFNNDCGTNCEHGKNDFTLFYDWIKDSEDEGRRFLAGKKTPGFSATKSLLSPLHGNCDPATVEPPPG